MLDDPILSALRSYERSPSRNEKKAVLLTPQGGYFLYGNRFCSILDYELELRSDCVQLLGDTVNRPVFLACMGDSFSVVGAAQCSLVSLIFHISLGEEDGLLRGILLAREKEARLTLFCDGATEEVYRLSRKMAVPPVPPAPPAEDLRQYAENLRRNDLHALTSLYLQGRQVRYLQGEYFP